MLGKMVTVDVTKPYGYIDDKTGIKYSLNYGTAHIRSKDNGTDKIQTSLNPLDKRKYYSFEFPAYILGIAHPVDSFEGRIICIAKHRDRRKNFIVVAPKRLNYINFQIDDALKFLNDTEIVKLECLYECSCGAVVYTGEGDKVKFLLIKNKRSSHWGFPKGHIERGETLYETAKREVFEETGIKIDIIDGFASSSDYKICSKIEKSVTIFLGKADSTDIKMQVEEIDDCIWVPYSVAMKCLLFENDKNILRKAYNFLK